MGNKNNKRCRNCKSKYQLTKHHTQQPHLNRKHPEKSKKTIILCITCHWQIDFWKTQKQMHKIQIRRYKKQNEKYFNNPKEYYKHKLNGYNAKNKIIWDEKYVG